MMQVGTWLIALLSTVSVTAAAEQLPRDGGSEASAAGSAANGSVSADEMRALVDGNNALAIKVLQQLTPELHGRNLIFSPVSVMSALGMAYAGAEGDTARQLAALLGTRGTPVQLPRVLGALLGQLRQHGRAADPRRA